MELKRLHGQTTSAPFKDKRLFPVYRLVKCSLALTFLQLSRKSHINRIARLLFEKE